MSFNFSNRFLFLKRIKRGQGTIEKIEREGEEWVVEGVNHNVFVFYFVGPASIKFVFSLIECYRPTFAEKFWKQINELQQCCLKYGWDFKFDFT